MNFLKCLCKNFKWVLLGLLILTVLVAVFIGISYLFGSMIYQLMFHVGTHNYIIMGIIALLFTFLMQILTIFLGGWFLLSWGQSGGVLKKKGGIG